MSTSSSDYLIKIKVNKIEPHLQLLENKFKLNIKLGFANLKNNINLKLNQI